MQGKIDIIQPDVSKCGGLTEIRKIGTLAGIYNRPVVTHNTQPTICTAAHWHWLRFFSIPFWKPFDSGGGITYNNRHWVAGDTRLLEVVS